MATIASPLSMRPCCLNSRSFESSNLSASPRYICGYKVTHSFDKMDMERKLFCTEMLHCGTRNFTRNQNMKAYTMPRVSIDSSSTEEKLQSSTEVQVLEKPLSYLFRTETVGGLVKVLVGKRDINYTVHIEASSLQLSNKNKFVLSWGTSRTPSDFENLDSDERPELTETPVAIKASEGFILDMKFETKETPFYFSFDIQSDTTVVRSHRKTRFCVPIGFASGRPSPLGLSFSNNGSTNFAFFSRNSESVTLCFFDEKSIDNPALEIGLDPYVNRSGDIWHVSIEKSPAFVSYGYRCNSAGQAETNAGKILSDPYAKLIGNSISNHLGLLCREPLFDWSGDIHPNLSLEKLVVYRLNVKRFTMDKSSKLPNDVAGTFSGVTEKLQHLKDLGVNAILLEPIFSFDEEKGPYSSCSFFSPMNLFGPSGDSISATNSLKKMVKILHENSIEVLLEVVFTHTAENGALQGIDDPSYYYLSEDSDSRSDLNCNYPIVQQMIVDSLRHWVTEFHIDGFCFINSSSLLRGFHGETLSRPPLIETIAFDPILSKTKIIADCWDPTEMVPKEVDFPHWKRWLEMNTKFCTDVRSFMKGDGMISDLATRLCGSGDIFSYGRGPAFSFNFISRNFGLSLVDLVSFSSSEQILSELSWNCGEEGPTSKNTVLETRLKQIRNFLFILYVSLGVPVLNMGDECGQSSGGSPAYENRKPLDWNALKTGFSTQITQFISFMTSLRIRRKDFLQKKDFLDEGNIEWHGSNQSAPIWDDPTSKFLAMTLKADKFEENDTWGDLFVACNAADNSERVILPTPAIGMAWFQLVDTALPYPGFFSTDGEIVVEDRDGVVAYAMKAYSCSLFEARRQSD